MTENVFLLERKIWIIATLNIKVLILQSVDGHTWWTKFYMNILPLPTFKGNVLREVFYRHEVSSCSYPTPLHYVLPHSHLSMSATDFSLFLFLLLLLPSPATSRTFLDIPLPLYHASSSCPLIYDIHFFTGSR